MSGLINGSRRAHGDEHPPLCVILGAGVQGLSIATELVSRRYRVVILARDLPEDVESSGFASPWAGADWASAAVNEKEERRDEITFHKFGELAKKHPELVKRRPFKTYSEDEPIKEPWYKDLVFNYHQVSPDELPSGFQYGSSYESYTLNSPRYIGHLSKELRSKGVQIVRRAISHVDEPWSLYPEASVVINATALGSRTLGGVEDPDVYPARGQTVLVKAPKAQSYCGVKRSWTEKVRTYVIPRPGPEGHVILGGTVERDEYSTKADMEIAERILKNAHAVCPELSEGRGSSWKDIEVVSHQAGLRPMRKGGMRLEVEHREVEVDGAHGVNGVSGEESNGVSGRRRKPCIHAYGVGPAGYQSSWGVAVEVADLVRACVGS